jgi:hypothetical protein
VVSQFFSTLRPNGLPISRAALVDGNEVGAPQDTKIALDLVDAQLYNALTDYLVRLQATGLRHIYPCCSFKNSVKSSPPGE